MCGHIDIKADGVSVPFGSPPLPRRPPHPPAEPGLPPPRIWIRIRIRVVGSGPRRFSPPCRRPLHVLIRDVSEPRDPQRGSDRDPEKGRDQDRVLHPIHEEGRKGGGGARGDLEVAVVYLKLFHCLEACLALDVLLKASDDYVHHISENPTLILTVEIRRRLTDEVRNAEEYDLRRAAIGFVEKFKCFYRAELEYRYRMYLYQVYEGNVAGEGLKAVFQRELSPLFLRIELYRFEELARKDGSDEEKWEAYKEEAKRKCEEMKREIEDGKGNLDRVEELALRIIEQDCDVNFDDDDPEKVVAQMKEKFPEFEILVKEVLGS